MTKEEAIKYLQQLYPYGGHCWLDEQRIEAVGMAIKALQEEPVNKDFEMALAEMVYNAQTSVVEPLVVAAQWKDELIKLAKSEEPVSEIDFEQELYKAFGHVKDFTLGMRIAKRFYDMGRNHQEPVSEEWIEELRTKLDSMSKEDFKKVFDKYAVDFNEEPVSEELEEAAFDYAEACKYDGGEKLLCVEHFKAGAQWQKHRDNIPSKDLEELINKLSCQFPEVSFAKLSRIAVRVSRWQRNQDTKNKLPEVINRTDLDEYAYQCAYDMSNDWAIENPTWHDVEDACKLGANWQKENLWKPANGDDLPEIDREVVAFQKTFPTDIDVPSLLKIVVAHRPNPKGYDGKSIATGKVEHYTPKTYDKGGWNIPNVVLWLDLNIPNLEED